MPANRMNRDEFYTAMTPVDDARLRKILWTLYWRGNAQFRSSSDEAQWIADGSVPAGPEPGYQGCCVRGNGWAAAIYDPGPNMHWNFLPVLKALGGRRVSG